MATAQDVRRVTSALPRSYEALVRDQVKFRVGRLVYLALSRDEESMGFAYPREERAALVASAPETFFMPVRSDERYNWVRARLAPLERRELHEIVVHAWTMVVPKFLAEEQLTLLRATDGSPSAPGAPAPDAPDRDEDEGAAR
ncbi:MmcQ/YjbR family DNA-binding protein [Streptomyces sp. NPDC018045]|uniref:MmcQ/YjbR family DNA-binding protein n=1 Tax=Streptomyces sp. NPDC018045 TaxID=3365037 RepID=UPI0037B488E5